MENENIEEFLLETSETPLESEENNPVLPEGGIPDAPVVEDVPETPDNVPEGGAVADPAVLEETGTGTEIVEGIGTQMETETVEDTETQTETEPIEDTEGMENTEGSAETENEENVYMDNGSEGFYSTLSGNGVMENTSGSSSDTYVTNYYEIVEEESPLLWDSNISELSSTDMLLFMIFLLLLVQFIHNLFKGSHWFKG